MKFAFRPKLGRYNLLRLLFRLTLKLLRALILNGDGDTILKTRKFGVGRSTATLDRIVCEWLARSLTEVGASRPASPLCD